MILGTLANIWHTFADNAPLLALILLVWWFIRTQPENEEAGDEDGGGGTKVAGPARHPHRPRPGPRHPRGPRRGGPHGGLRTPAPPRVRTVRARSGTPSRH